jgi:hypothetical protein
MGVRSMPVGLMQTNSHSWARRARRTSQGKQKRPLEKQAAFLGIESEFGEPSGYR